MKNLVLFGIFVLFLVAMQFAGGRTVDEIIEKHIRTKGGHLKLDDIQRIYMEGIITLLGIAALIKITKVQQEMNPAGFNLELQITGEEGSSLAEHFNTAFVEDIVTGKHMEPDLSAQLINYADNDYTAILAGKDVVDGINCYHLKLTGKEENILDYWISTQDFLMVQSSLKNNITGSAQTETWQTKYNDYRMVNGLQIAYALKIQMIRLNEKIPVEISFDKIMINQSPDKIF